MPRSALIALAFALLATPFGPAGAQVYEWRDEIGGLNASDRPPPGVQAREISTGRRASPPEASVQQRFGEQPQAMQRSRNRLTRTRDRGDRSQDEAAQREHDCELARNHLTAQGSDRPISRHNAGGERATPDAAEQRQRVQAFIDAYCD